MSIQKLWLIVMSLYKTQTINDQTWILEGLIGTYFSLLNYWLLEH